MQNNRINYTSFVNSDGSNAKVIVTKPWLSPMNDGIKKNLSVSNHQPMVDSMSNRQPQKYETLKKFIPSPELIVDSSQSSESHEKFVINNKRYVVSPVS